MYVVRFVRKDGQPDEEYYYHRLEDAQFHFNLFKDDDSDLYCTIYIFRVNTSTNSEDLTKNPLVQEVIF